MCAYCYTKKRRTAWFFLRNYWRSCLELMTCRPLNLVVFPYLNLLLEENHLNEFARGVGVLRRLASVIPTFVLRKLYFSLIYTHITYCLPVWGGASVTYVGRVQLLQNRAARIMTGQRRTGDSLRQLNLFNVSELHKYFSLILFHKYYVMNSGMRVGDRVMEIQTDHCYTRCKTAEKLTLPYPRISKFTQSFVYKSIDYWNTLPLQIRKIVSSPMFKSSVKYYLQHSE